jgi:hypothetical protein
VRHLPTTKRTTCDQHAHTRRSADEAGWHGAHDDHRPPRHTTIAAPSAPPPSPPPPPPHARAASPHLPAPICARCTAHHSRPSTPSHPADASHLPCSRALSCALSPSSSLLDHSALGLMILGFMLLLFQLDVVDGDAGLASERHAAQDANMLNHSELQPPRSRRDHTDLAQLTPRERRSLTCRLGEAYQRWNETEGACTAPWLLVGSACGVCVAPRAREQAMARVVWRVLVSRAGMWPRWCTWRRPTGGQAAPAAQACRAPGQAARGGARLVSCAAGGAAARGERRRESGASCGGGRRRDRRQACRADG